ncbi:MAG: AAA family ATPase [Sneathiella sp.]|nr:AAA family ATPase [Sneathiella sp.]
MSKIPTTLQQDELIAFLKDAGSYPENPDHVDFHETHGAMIFLAGCFAYKIKKAVKFPYMDFSTLEKRHHFCARELEINQPHAPDLYQCLVAITQNEDGSLTLGGDGTVVEWALKMRRFDQNRMLDRLPHSVVMEKTLVNKLTEAVFKYHQAAARINVADGPQRMQLLIQELLDSFHASRDVFTPGTVKSFEMLAMALLERAHYCLRLRGRRGFIRRCHGDLHLRNIVLMGEQPVLFDALEFDEDLATTDVLYDLAFLLMDLDQRGMSPAANRVLNRYLYYSNALEDIYGLIAMPLFLAIRAGVRAMVAVDHARQLAGDAAAKELTAADQYFFTALQYLQQKPPILIAVGGFSGTGKTTLAELLAGSLEHAPGFLHFRSDLERKSLFNVSETERLDPSCYTMEVNKQVYGKLLHKVRIALKAHQRVIVDAVFSKPEERAEFEALAKKFDIPFIGLWLEADEELIASRVTARTMDASDATPAIVHQQVARGVSSIQWHRIDASGTEFETLKNVMAIPEISNID